VHDGSRSGDYTVLYDPAGLEYTNAEGAAGIQIGWACCRKCWGLFLTNPMGNCPAGGAHDPSQSAAYVIQTGPAPGMQTGWLVCQKCQGLFFAGNPNQGVCPAGGSHSSDGHVGYDLQVGPVYTM
jgi:hypothetical protein